MVRSENGYGLLRPGLKTSMGNGIFWSEIGSGFGDAPTKNSKEYPAPRGLAVSEEAALIQHKAASNN